MATRIDKKATEIAQVITPDPMEQISAEAMQKIAVGIQLIIEVLERIDPLRPEMRKMLEERLKKLKAILMMLQEYIEKLMEIGEPKVAYETLLPAEFLRIAEEIKSAGHEPVVTVLDKDKLAERGIPFETYQKFGKYAINYEDLEKFIATRGLAYYVMKQVSVEQAKKIAETLKLQPAKNRGLSVYYFAEKEDYLTEIITWEEMAEALKANNLAIYSLQDEWLWVMPFVPEEAVKIATR